uniref:RRM domain-containing protein n=1 Tax=Tanacetum cinerariifolium TaxID=118510 RepID=A0A6L2MTP8_TANCI|nr:hypothetical protein [Tanacetum cinerariifolium]
MGNCRSKEDDVNNISTSIFVTNFPDSTTTRDLWRMCNQYGNVIDAFFPNRRPKAGKHFGFVRFIKVFEVDRLVNNLCMIWFDRLRLHANIAKFNRGPLKPKVNVVNMSSSIGSHNVNGTFRPLNSSLRVVIKGHLSQSVVEDLKPALVLDDDCAFNSDLSLAVFGKLKEFESLSNIKKSLATERFNDVVIRYIGDYIFESFKIIVNGKIFWVRAKEVTGWALKFFDTQDVFCDSDVGLVDVNGDALSENGKDHLHSEVEEIPETVFEEGEIKSTDIKEKSNEVQQEAQSDDPFNIYGLLKTKHPVSNATCQFEEEPKYPPGFTPRDNSVNFDCASGGADIHQKGSSEKENGSNTCFKEDVNASACSGHFKKLKKDSALFLIRASAFNSFITSGGLVEVPSDENIFETFKIIVKCKIFWIRAKEVTGWTQDFNDCNEDLSNTDEDVQNVKSEDNMKNIILDVDSAIEEIPKTIFEQADHGDIKSTAEKGRISKDIEDGQSADPFNLYDLLKKKKHVYVEILQTQEEPKYPPGFTPCVTSEVNSNVEPFPSRGAEEHNKNIHDMAKVSLVTKHVPN